MTSHHGLPSFDDAQCQALPTDLQQAHLLQWLRQLEIALPIATKEDLVAQPTLKAQLSTFLFNAQGPVIRKAAGRCIGLLFHYGNSVDMSTLSQTLIDIIKSTKDDGSTLGSLKLGAIVGLECIFNCGSKGTGVIYNDASLALLKLLKVYNEPGIRVLLLECLTASINSTGSSFPISLKEIYKSVRSGLTDRALTVRKASSECLRAIVCQSSLLYTTELDTVVGLCVKSFDGANYAVRRSVTDLLAAVLTATQEMNLAHRKLATTPTTPEEILTVLVGSFSKASGSPESVRDVRTGIAYSLAALLDKLGGEWLSASQNLSLAISRTLSVLVNYKVLGGSNSINSQEAIVARRCVSFVFRRLFLYTLGEGARLEAIKELTASLSIHCHASSTTSPHIDGDPQNMLIVAMYHIADNIKSLGTAAMSVIGDIIEPIFSILKYPSVSVRLAAAWLLCQLATVIPAYLSPFLSRCLDAFASAGNDLDSTSGYGFAVAALIGVTPACLLGIPHSLPRVIFVTAVDGFSPVANNPKLTIARTELGWSIVSALVGLGPSFVLDHLSQLFLLWREAFPRKNKDEKVSSREAQSPLTLAIRTGALSSIEAFIHSCPDILTTRGDVLKRIANFLNAALILLAAAPDPVILPSFDPRLELKRYRVRLYRAFMNLPLSSYEASFTTLLRLQVAGFTLKDTHSDIRSSIVHTACHPDDVVVLSKSNLPPMSDHLMIEVMMSRLPVGALENDPYQLCINEIKRTCDEIALCDVAPCPLPLEVVSVDAAIEHFAMMFPRLSAKHHQQLLDHLLNCIQHAKPQSSRFLSIQANALTALVLSLRSLIDAKISLPKGKVSSAARTIIVAALTSNDEVVRCAAAEATGLLAKVVEEERSSIIEYAFERLKTDRDAESRTGHLLALGSIHRHVGGLFTGGSLKHLKTTVGLMHALSGDATPTVAAWALHALAITVDAAGVTFGPLVKGTLSIMVSLLTAETHTFEDVQRALGRLFIALSNSVGPELQFDRPTCDLFLLCADELRQSSFALVPLDAVNLSENLLLYAPNAVDILKVTKGLRVLLSSPQLLVRRAAVRCLRQLVQREPHVVSQHGDYLEERLLKLMDAETDSKLLNDVKELVRALMLSLAQEMPERWLLLFEGVLSNTLSKVGNAAASGDQHVDRIAGDCISGGDEDMATLGGAFSATSAIGVGDQTPRWPTKVFAVECLQQLVTLVADQHDGAHFDLTLARTYQSNALKRGEKPHGFLVFRLSDIIRTAFNAATATVDTLQLVGLSTLRVVITRFAHADDPDDEGHKLLEQYQAQISAALRPAFAVDTSPRVTAAACGLCAVWVGSGVVRDPVDLVRVTKMLVSLLEQVEENVYPAYNESLSSMIRLALLTAWAAITISCRTNCPYLRSIVNAHVDMLRKHWLHALRDFAILVIPEEFCQQVPTDFRTFYAASTADTVLPYYQNAWPQLSHAVALQATEAEPLGRDFFLLFGLCIRGLTGRQNSNDATDCIETLRHLLRPSSVTAAAAAYPEAWSDNLIVELMGVLHRTLQSYELSIQRLVMELVVELVSPGGIIAGGSEIDGCPYRVDDSVILALLEVCACVLLRQFPGLNPPPKLYSQPQSSIRLASGTVDLVRDAISVLALLPAIDCSNVNCATNEIHDENIGLQVLPTVLFMLLGVLEFAPLVESDMVDTKDATSQLTTVVVLALKRILSRRIPCLKWRKIICCGLSYVLDSLDKKMLAENSITSSAPLLITTALFITDGGVDDPTLLTRSSKILHHHASDRETNETVRIAALQALISTSRTPNVGLIFIRASLPDILILLQSPKETPLGIIREAIRMLETATSLAGPDLRIHLVGAAIPLLVELLSTNAENSTPDRHVCALEALLRLGPLYPTEFKAVVSVAPTLKSRLEAAVRENMSNTSATTIIPNGGESSTSKAAAYAAVANATPTIELKMSFNGFT